ncbi:MAG: hypothetical protein AUJ96_11585 [Armatimonadetes bacterium CG2_30_66_41]|nr:HEPN domain-containing protein [Armatimonadota bacterium]OIP05043.1 MAG: hypothetical protein AUJ96_11585 [Armatimonadetes bacterium CG2_30_66_41]NCO95874.1 HEPN domain-containing protein [Armatimonadota bacterium]NCP29844.1 HEPN domain-containing protein [Armatimonadota bacterium]NCQ28755.1 HEPN domain-containing protein [Armatimonadota bacterium]
MASPHAVAEAFFIESRDDLEAAALLADHGKHSKCLEHAQKAAEKSLKGALALRGVILAVHAVTETFVVEFSDLLSEESIRRLQDAADALEGRGTRFEYPFFGRPDLPVWIPSRDITASEAREGLDHARCVCAIVAGLPLGRVEDLHADR